jgi:hypothetical protein
MARQLLHRFVGDGMAPRQPQRVQIGAPLCNGREASVSYVGAPKHVQMRQQRA